MKTLMTIKVHDGLIFRLSPLGSEDVFSAPEADSIARANGFQYAEQFCRANNGRTLRLDIHWQAHVIPKERLRPLAFEDDPPPIA